MDTKLLRQKILDLAIHGKLVPQNPKDEPASMLLERIKAEKDRLIKDGKIKKSAKTSDTNHYEKVPFEIPSSWVWTTLGYVCKKLTDGSHNPPPKQLKGYTVISAQNIKNGGIIFTDKDRYADEAGFQKENPRTKISKGDIILGIIGGSIGNVGIYEHSKPVIAQRSISIIDTHILNPFCYYLLQSRFFQSIFLNKSIGNAQAGIYLGELEKLQIPLPPLSEQRRIVAEIEKWFSLIDIIESSKNDLQSTIKQTKSKILDLAIHGKLVPQNPKDEPAIELLKRINPKAEISCDNALYPFEVPSGWAWTKLGYVCKFISGFAFDSNDYTEKGTKLIRISNIQSNTIDISSCVCVEDPKIENLYVKRGDLLIAMSGATTGKMGIYLENELALLNQRVGNIRTIDNLVLHPKYRNYFMQSMSDYILKLAYGGAQPNISAKEISAINIPIPPLAEQQRIVTKIEELFAVIDNIQKSLEA